MEGDAKQIYFEEIKACPELKGLLNDAELIRIDADQPGKVCAIQDWTYSSKKVAGNGWAMAGDAAGFADPILSSGIMLAHELGQKAAYTINSMFSSADDEKIRAYWSHYDQTFQTYLKGYCEMAAFWYSNNFAMGSWWWEAQRVLNQEQTGMALSDRDAFVRIASGYANRTESISLFGAYPLEEAKELVKHLFGEPSHTAELEAEHWDRPLKMNDSAQLTMGLYYWQGFIHQTMRVVNKNDSSRYLDLHQSEGGLVQYFDGQHTLADLNQAASELQQIDSRVRNGNDLARQLDTIGVLD
jgi:hypothetical protein